MKISNDYEAKLDIWARNPQVHAMPGIANLPRFRSRKFRSYEEMNAWKRELLEQIAINGGVVWTKS